METRPSLAQIVPLAPQTNFERTSTVSPSQRAEGLNPISIGQSSCLLGDSAIVG